MKELFDAEPLMQCKNKYEFLHRLQWLSEGVLHVNVGQCDFSISQTEIAHYKKYKEKC